MSRGFYVGYSFTYITLLTGSLTNLETLYKGELRKEVIGRPKKKKNIINNIDINALWEISSYFLAKILKYI